MAVTLKLSDTWLPDPTGDGGRPNAIWLLAGRQTSIGYRWFRPSGQYQLEVWLPSGVTAQRSPRRAGFSLSAPGAELSLESPRLESASSDEAGALLELGVCGELPSRSAVVELPHDELGQLVLRAQGEVARVKRLVASAGRALEDGAEPGLRRQLQRLETELGREPVPGRLAVRFTLPYNQGVFEVAC